MFEEAKSTNFVSNETWLASLGERIVFYENNLFQISNMINTTHVEFWKYKPWFKA